MALIQTLKRHPLLTYFVLVYVLAWAFWIPLALIGPFSYESLYNSPLHPFGLALSIVGESMPSLLGILLTALFSGKSGLRELFRRLGRVRVPLIWYAVVLLLLPVLWLVAVSIPTLLGLATITFAWSGSIALDGLVPGLIEELGWRGFALPRLQARQSAFAASLLLGVLWGLWHLPLRIALGLPLTAAGLVQFIFSVLELTAWTVLFTWVYNNTKGSLFLMVLFHASGNIAQEAIAAPGTFLGHNGIAFILNVILLWVTVTMVVVLAGAARLSRSSSLAPDWDGERLFEDR